MSTRRKVILAGSVYAPEPQRAPAAVFTEGPRIVGIIPAPRREALTEAYRRALLQQASTEFLATTDGAAPWLSAEWIEAWDRILTPGFIEVHTNGAGGYDAMDSAPDTLIQMARVLARFGTTAFLPTLITAPKAEILRGLTSLAQAVETARGGATPLGIHLEGPFLSPSRRGTHPMECLRPPTIEFLTEALDAARGRLKILTLAPELPGALEVIERLRRDGVIAALGHSDATYEETQQGIEAGARHAVHLFNAMRPFNHRDPGIIGAILNDDRISAEIITDGIHVHPQVVRTLFRAKRRDGIVLSTDSISAAAMPDGGYLLSGKRVTVTGGVCRDADGRLAGSSLTQDQALRHLMAWAEISAAEAVAAATVNAARVLGLENKGRIRPGADADLVLLSDRWEVETTIVLGEIVYRKNTQG